MLFLSFIALNWRPSHHTSKCSRLVRGIANKDYASPTTMTLMMTTTTTIYMIYIYIIIPFSLHWIFIIFHDFFPPSQPLFSGSSHWSHFCFLTVAWACKWPAFCVPTLSGKLIFPNYRVSIHLDFIWSHFRYLPIPYTPWTLTVRPWKWAKKTPPNSETIIF